MHEPGDVGDGDDDADDDEDGGDEVRQEEEHRQEHATEIQGSRIFPASA